MVRPPPAAKTEVILNSRLGGSSTSFSLGKSEKPHTSRPVGAVSARLKSVRGPSVPRKVFITSMEVAVEEKAAHWNSSPSS